MANYSITLNLRGTAVKSAKQLADNLERADKAAKALKGNLQGMPNVPTGGYGGYGGYGGHRPTYGSTFGGVSAVTSFSTQSGLGTVFRFSGKLNSALAIIDSVMSAASQAVKIVGKANIAFYTGGASLLKKGADILISPQMGEGIRLLQRRQQARLGFGEKYAEAQERADLLAASYGLDPSNVIASMNVLTGMKVGKKNISVAQAARLTQVGGLIAQSSGTTFENVMINIQQMMAQTVPSMRDIRQLLTHAPILSRYALQEMGKRGIVGGDPMEFLQQNKDVMMSVFERYLAESPAILTMRARGIAQQANIGFYATLAENPAWLAVADKYLNMIQSLAESLSKGLSTISNSEAVRMSINAFIVLMEKLPSILESVTPKLDAFITALYEKFGLSYDDTKGETVTRTEQELWVEKEIRRNEATVRAALKEAGFPEPTTPEETVRIATSAIRLFGNAHKFVETSDIPEGYENRYAEILKTYAPNIRAASVANNKKALNNIYNKALRQVVKEAVGADPSLFESGDPSLTGYYTGRVAMPSILDAIKARALEDSSLNGLGGTNAGNDVSGYGKDRKALVINFNAPIVEWDSTINADDPQDVVNTVSETIEGAATRAIQIALLGATGKMNTRF